jgi:hypothetical protein
MAETAPVYEEAEPLPNPDAAEIDEIEIEVLDDTPEEDQRPNRAAMGYHQEDDDESLDQEIEAYGVAAQDRIKKLKYDFHEERRAKESALRASEEATRFARQVAQDNAALKQNLDNSHSVLAAQYGERNEAEMETARKQYKEAYEAGETDDLLAAQEKISRLTAERMFRPAPVQREQQQQQQPAQTQQVGTPDAKSTKWLQENSWFHGSGTEDMTGYAIGLHQKLVRQGFDPRIHDEYYTKIDEGMRTVFPEYKFSDAENTGGNGTGVPAVTQTRKAPPKVGGPSRGGKTPRKVQLTTTQVALAKRLGLTNKQYAAQVAKDTLTNG